MQKARLLSDRRSQTVRIPHEYQFKGNDVYIQKFGDAEILFPVDKEWEAFLYGLYGFSVTIQPPLLNGTNPPPEWGLGGLLPPGEGVAEDRAPGHRPDVRAGARGNLPPTE
jgi:antitoxin VapB